MATPTCRVVRCALAAAICLAAVALPLARAQGPQEGLARRVDERVRALQTEAQRLASRSRTLLGDLRRLEIERDLQAARAEEAEAAASAADAALQETTARLARIEARRVAQLPDLRARLVDIYKRGRGGYVRLLLGVDDVREMGRAMRAVSALARINERRVADHRQTLDALRQERAVLETRTRELHDAQRQAEAARAAAARAVSAHNALIADIDRRRDLNAQLTGELQAAQQRLSDVVAAAAAGRHADPVSVPVAAFRGALDWPVEGRVIGRFGRSAGRLGGSAVRNGIEIGAGEGASVRAVHGGTVAFADPFTGFGTLVIVDHGAGHFSLYGYLARASVQRGVRVDAGDELGRVGAAPAGPPALYFEMRVDGRSVDPLQWLRSR